jgi:hypothetical protein
MVPTRIAAIVDTARLDRSIERARRHEREAFARAGELVARSGDRSPDLDPRLDPKTAVQVRELRLEIDALGKAIAASRAADQTDYVAVSSWIRPVVIARGLCARTVLRHHRARCRRRLRPLYEVLGAAALAALPGERAMLGVPETLAEAARHAGKERETAAAERVARLAPFRGAAVPAWASSMRREGQVLGKAMGKQLQEKLLPRVSALAGLAAGWWVANTYTDSHWKSALRSLGIGRGGTQVVSSESLQAMSFWLPILSAALCAYLGSRLAFLIRRRYAPHPPSA